MATLTGKQLKDSYQGLLTIKTADDANPLSGRLENGLGNAITNLGIGTDSPNVLLHIKDTSSNNGLRIETSNTDNGFIHFADTDNDNIGRVVYSHSDDSMQFVTNDNERMRIDSNGNVGMNATPENSAGTWRNYQLGSLSMAGRTNDSAPDAMFGTNFKFTTANAEQRISAHATSRLFFNDDAIIFQNAGSDTAGSSISWNERMRIDSSGNLLIGATATPTSSAGNIVLNNGTAPTGNATDGVILYAEDVLTFSELKVRDEAGNVTTLSPHNFSLIPDGASEPMAWAYYSERDGKKINVDMLKLARMVESLTGEKLVYEQ